MYELRVLALLIRNPMHGYLIMKVTNDQIGPWARISSGTLSTILSKLEQEGNIVAFIPVARNKARRSRTFTITAEGRKRFHQLMMDTSTNLGDYQRVFYYKMGSFDLLRPDERLLLCNHYSNYCQALVLHLQTEMESLVHELAEYSDPTYLAHVVRVMKHVEQNWLKELDWLKEIRE